MQPAAAQAYYEPSMTILKLPRCANPACPDPVHPMAVSDYLDPSVCPGCGGPASLPCEEQTVKATYTGEPS